MNEGIWIWGYQVLKKANPKMLSSQIKSGQRSMVKDYNKARFSNIYGILITYSSAIAGYT